MKVSRRKLASVLAGAAAAAGAVDAQAPPPADADLDAARSLQRIAAQVIARVPLPAKTEPAFSFKA